MLLDELLHGLSALGTVQIFTVSVIPVVFAITVHEAAHGYVAKYFGDMTAFQEGRITLNPIKHIDPFGTILLPILVYWASHGSFLFGSAKPVPVNFSRLRNPKKDMLWVAAAGPTSNLAMAIIWALVIKLSMLFPSSFTLPLAFMGAVGVQINIVLMVLNLLPLPPLDGGRIAVSLLPHHLAYRYAMAERYGLIILLALLFTGVLWQIMSPFIAVALNIISKVFL